MPILGVYYAYMCVGCIRKLVGGLEVGYMRVMVRGNVEPGWLMFIAWLAYGWVRCGSCVHCGYLTYILYVCYVGGCVDYI